MRLHITVSKYLPLRCTLGNIILHEAQNKNQTTQYWLNTYFASLLIINPFWYLLLLHKWFLVWRPIFVSISILECIDRCKILIFSNKTSCCYRSMQEAQYDTKAIFVFDGCVIISFGLTTNQEDDSTRNN